MKRVIFFMALFLFGTVGIATANLVVNGDFSAGNTGFTSDYTFYNPMKWQPNRYGIITGNALFGDHTTGIGGNYMGVDGSGTANKTVWQETITVSQNTDYVFEAWAKSTYNGPDITLDFRANGSRMGTLLLYDRRMLSGKNSVSFGIQVQTKA